MNSNVSKILTEVHKVIIGKDEVLEKILMTLLSRGHVLLERSLAQLQDNMVKLQVVFPDGMEDVPAELPVLHASKLGRVHTLIMRMNAQEATERLMAYSPLLVDAVPLTLEEIFIYELGGADYAVKDIVL